MKEVVDTRPMTPRAVSVRRWAAYATCAWTFAGYGTLKLHWALGGTALTSSAPLPRSAREELVAQSPAAIVGHWISVGLVVLGALAALATVRPWGRVLPRRLLTVPMWITSVLMVLRACGAFGFGVVGDALVLSGVQRVGPPNTEIALHLSRVDLLLWSPYFLIWGLLWGATAWATPRRQAPLNRPSASRPTGYSPTGIDVAPNPRRRSLPRLTSRSWARSGESSVAL
ncbi:DUF3995 domain-containing protein [Streptomyces sp. NPDC048383]|uniref:DUF3995 domain-containing protein n=1 Tax=Streptomyces sp. NPDC048383 TaxID=3155386 RepID=UPI00343B0C29